MRKNELNCLNMLKAGYFDGYLLKELFDNSDSVIVTSILKSAKQNVNHNEFPDFYFDGGIIEHFEITPSREDKKGSRYKIDDVVARKKTEAIFGELDKKYIESKYEPGRLLSKAVEDIHDSFSYDYFVKSFKSNCEKHLLSLNKSEYVDTIVVFLIEQQVARLGVYENNRFKRFYRLSEDKNLLLYIKNKLQGTDYIFYVTYESYEIIDLSAIDSVIASCKDNLDIRGERQINVTLRTYLDI